MKVLGIETSGSIGGFAVVDGGSVLGEITCDITGRHLEKGLEIMEDVLERACVGADDLGGIAVSVGPGSFTGLRVGLAIAKGICFGKRIRLAGVATLDCIAWGLSCWDGVIVPLRDARRGEVYFSVYRSKACDITRISDYLALRPEQAVTEIKRLGRGRGVLLSGDALIPYGEILRSELGGDVTLAPQSLWIARPAIVATIGSELLNRGIEADPTSIEPLYVRPSEAERSATGGVGGRFTRNQKNDRA
jgi:tRNA threonylcarbamoyladenosine biosynthesis protein TsaB